MAKHIILLLALVCASGQAQVAFLSPPVGGSPRTDATLYVGYKVTVAAAPIAVTALGRYCAAGSSLTHVVYLSTAAGAVKANATVNMSGCTTGTFVYAAASTTLSASTSYYMTSSELTGGDTWQDCCLVNLVPTAVATIPTAAYSPTAPPAAPTGFVDSGGVANSGYGPSTFQYSVGGSTRTLALTGAGQ